TRPRKRKVWRALRALSASTMPRSLRPAASTASYWYDGMRGPPSALARDAQDFLERGHALGHPALCVLVQAAHALASRGVAQGALAAIRVDQIAQRIIQHEQFVDTGAAAVAGMAAGRAALRVPGRRAIGLGRLALRAK